jgi:hypothetical protein
MFGGINLKMVLYDEDENIRICFHNKYTERIKMDLLTEEKNTLFDFIHNLHTEIIFQNDRYLSFHFLKNAKTTLI